MSLLTIDDIRLEASRSLDPKRRSDFGQFMTPSGIARFMASLFSPSIGQIRLLDAGAGIGSLTSAFLERNPQLPVRVEAWELDPLLRTYLERTLSQHADQGAGVDYQIHADDFIESATWNISMGTGSRFTRAILNPPYRKIGSSSHHRLLLRQCGIETVNLYTAFLALAILLMEPGGEIVAIIPRSFCNGTYYRPFRKLLLDHCAIQQIHLFEARDKAFADDAVLQENIIIKLVRGKEQSAVVVSDCRDGEFSDYRQRSLSFQQIVHSGDPELFIHIPAFEPQDAVVSPLFAATLKDVGLDVCTGPVVDFRLRQHCSAELGTDDVPLLYAHHFPEGLLSFPSGHKKKPNAIANNEQTRKWLMPRGNYVLIRRFSAKEERRRVVAFVLEEKDLPTPCVGFENHLNVIHEGRRGLDLETARGLAAFLNSTLVDACFRAFSGHTQVNATDLRQLRFPSREQLRRFGHWVGGRRLTQAEIDDYLQRMEHHG